MRTFISVELPDEIKKNITALVNELKNLSAAVKWVEPKNLHITLKFLGWVDEKNLDNLIELAAKAVAESRSFKAKFEGMGTFPEGKKPRVVWVGTAEGGDELCKIAQSLEKTLSKAGFRSEEREFKPHISIGRVKEKAPRQIRYEEIDKLEDKIKGLQNEKFGETMVDRIHIMKSTLTPTGPIYEKVKEIKLL
jgi:2'-5' RNA ligase